MKDIRVDKDGNLRCASCGGRNFHGRRTARAHIIGYVTVGVGALATQKKLRCQACGEYNKQGNAKPWREPAGVQYVRVDDDGDFRCWHCGFTEFVTPPNVADMTFMQALKAPWVAQSAAEANRGKCKRCGHRNEMSNPRPWEGPVSKKNWD